MKFSLLLPIIICITSTANINAQDIKKAEWSRTKMDSSFNAKKDAQGNYINSKSGSIIAKYKPGVDALQTVIGHTNKDITKYSPESPLSNFAVDIMRATANDYLKKHKIKGHVNIALTNFGGIRTNINKGDITIADITSVFPFENKIVIVDITGANLKKMFEKFAKRERVEALSGVKLIIEDHEIEKILINGKRLNDNKVYKLATIDFLLGGGDGVYLNTKNSNIIATNILIRDAVIDYIKAQTDRGKEINPIEDNRVIITD